MHARAANVSGLPRKQARAASRGAACRSITSIHSPSGALRAPKIFGIFAQTTTHARQSRRESNENRVFEGRFQRASCGRTSEMRKPEECKKDGIQKMIPAFDTDFERRSGSAREGDVELRRQCRASPAVQPDRFKSILIHVFSAFPPVRQGDLMAGSQKWRPYQSSFLR